MCSALVRWRGLWLIFAYRTRHTKCVARFFVGVAYVGSLLIERAIHSGVAHLFVGVAYVGSLLIERGIHSGVARLFVGMAYVGSLLIERGIHCV